MKLGSLELYETPLVERKNIALINSSSSWASNERDLGALYSSNYVAAITTRTAVVTANDVAGSEKWSSVFDEKSVHNHAFLKDSLPTIEGGRLTIARGSINSYGYSPHSLSNYMEWIAALLKQKVADDLGSEQRKPFIISVTGPPAAIEAAIVSLRQWAATLPAGSTSQSNSSASQYIAVEINLSCPNIKGNDAPSGYDVEAITEYVIAAQRANSSNTSSSTSGPQLPVGLKLPPYIFPAQFKHILKALESVQIGKTDEPHHPITFLTSTNTLGGSFWLNEGEKAGKLHHALPTTSAAVAKEQQQQSQDPDQIFDGTGGLAGESLHPISLGNVYKLRTLLDASTDARLKSIQIIGVGGVASGLSAQRMVKAGASNVVGVATALGREGVDAFERISNEILDYAGFDEDEEDEEGEEN